jgi:DNA-binding MarR family transcriptional regulator
VSDAQVARLADDLYDVLGLLRRRSRRLVGAPFPDLALSGAQLELVRVIRRNPGVAVAHAATMLGLAPNTVSTLVGQLVALEVVVRDRDENDRRLARLHLTPAARETLEQWRDRRAHATAAALGDLDDDDKARLAAALPVIARVAAALSEDAPVLDPAGSRLRKAEP